jgi:hypothetical protein
MKRRYLLLLLLVAFICFALMFYVFKKCLKDSKRALTYGTVSAVNAALVSELETENATLKEIFSSADHYWRFLTVEEYDRVITELAKSHNLDPSPKPSQPLIDHWENRLEIYYRKLPNQAYETIVVSKGPDGVYRTADDVANPGGFNVAEQLPTVPKNLH